MAALCGFDGIDVADDVRDGYIGRGQLLHEARVTPDPFDGRHVAIKPESLAAVRRDGMKRIVIDFGPGDYRDLFVKQFGELAYDATLGLAAQAKQDQIMSRQDRIHELRNDRIVIADDPWEKFFAGF